MHEQVSDALTMPKKPPSKVKRSKRRIGRRIKRKIAALMLRHHLNVPTKRYRPFRIKET